MEVQCAHTALVVIKELKPNPKNPNKHTPEQIKLLAKIMNHQGWRAPIVVSKRSGFITKGHGRLEAAKLNKWKDAPVDVQDYANEEDEYADMVADNEIARLAQSDKAMILAEVLDFGPEFDFDLLGIPDFKLPEDFEPGCDEDEVPEHVEPKTKLGDLYQLGNHRLLCGDSTSIDAVEKLMNGEKADMVFTDPPYGIGYVGGSKKRSEIENDARDEDFEEFLQNVFPIFGLAGKPGAPVYICSPVGLQAGEFFKAWQTNDYHYQCCLVWVKQNASFTRFDYHTKHEFIHYGWLPGAAHTWEGDRKQDTVWLFDRPSKSEAHPTMKPIDLIEYAIKNSSKSSASVLDLFGGSGSTLIACEKTNRKCFMMELDPHYCDVIVARWEKFTGKKAELING